MRLHFASSNNMTGFYVTKVALEIQYSSTFVCFLEKNIKPSFEGMLGFFYANILF